MKEIQFGVVVVVVRLLGMRAGRNGPTDGSFRVSLFTNEGGQKIK